MSSRYTLATLPLLILDAIRGEEGRDALDSTAASATAVRVAKLT